MSQILCPLLTPWAPSLHIQFQCISGHTSTPSRETVDQFAKEAVLVAHPILPSRPKISSHCFLSLIYTFAFTTRLATCTNIRRLLSLREWTVFPCVRTFARSCLCVNRINFDSCKHSHVIWLVWGKPLQEWALQMTSCATRRLCNPDARRSPCYSTTRHSHDCVNPALQKNDLMRKYLESNYSEKIDD